MVRGIRLGSLACLWLMPVLIFSMAFASDWVSVWEKLRLPEYFGPFMDTRVIASGVRTQKMGGDPLVSNPADRTRRQIPYPRIWVYLFWGLGITESRVPFVGVLFSVLYLICISWLMNKSRGSFDSLILFIAAMSLAPLLAMERGNIDLIIFFLIFLGVAATNRFLKTTIYFVATLLKIYPIATLGVEAIRRPLRAALLPIGAAFLAVVLLALQWRDLISISRTAPITTFLSFGTLSLVVQAKYLSGALLAGCCIAIVLIATIAWRARPALDQEIWNSQFGELFLVFGGIYAFTFAIGANYNYRLIFLIPTLPLVFPLARYTKYRAWAMTYICAVLAAENSFFLGVYQGIPLGDLSTFTIFAMILPILFHKSKEFFSNAAADLRGSVGHSERLAESSARQ